jgi:hypothetical protein
MKHKETQKKFKDKKCSCAMCKPHKRHWCDCRTLAQRKQDERLIEMLEEV